MKEYVATNIRNIALVGHSSEGKTALAEAMLYDAGAIDRMGKSTDGTTTTDYDPEEIKRSISISMALAPVEWKDYKLNVIDVPGYFDMVGEMAAALRVVEGALIVVGAVSGLSVGTEKAWDFCEKYGASRMVVINQMDRENANFQQTLEQLQDKYGTAVVPMQLPIMEGGFAGYVDLVKGQAYRFSGKEAQACDMPEAIQDEVESIREQLIEGAAGAVDELMEKYFEEGELSDEEIIRGLRQGILDGSVVPVVCASAFENKGVIALMDAMADYMPSPADVGPIQAVDAKSDQAVEIQMVDDAPFTAFVFKTLSDNFVGKISIFKIYSGVMSADLAISNVRTGKSEKISAVSTLRGKKTLTAPKLHAGDIGILAKLASTNTNDTLCGPGVKAVFPAIEFPAPSIGFAVEAAKQGEEDKVFGGLGRLAEEDPSFHIVKNPDTGENILEGQGEMQLDIIVSKLASKFNVKAVLNDPKIPYRETIRKPVRVQGRHKKQSGGHGQFGDVWIEFEPILDGSSTAFEFVDKVVGGSVPRQYIPAVEKGLHDCIRHGVLAGCPVVGLRASLVDGSYHPVDSSEMAFKTAASLAFKKGCADANPVLLEPICHVEVLVPDADMGDIIGDLNRRRGRIAGMNPQSGGLQQVVAEVPQSEMFKYATDLRSMTQARGSFTMTFDHYEEVPANIAQKVIAQAQKDMAEE